MRRRVTVLVLSVCLCVCPLSHISPLERLFVMKLLSHTKWAMEVKKFVGFSLKPLRCGDPALLHWKPYVRSAIFLRKARMRIIVIKGHEYPRRVFCTSVHSFFHDYVKIGIIQVLNRWCICIKITRNTYSNRKRISTRKCTTFMIGGVVN